MRSGVTVALPLTAMSSQFVIGSFEARFFPAGTVERRWLGFSSDQVLAHRPDGGLRAVRNADFSQNVLDVLFHRFVADA